MEEVYTNLCGYGGGCSVHNDALYGDEYRWDRCVAVQKYRLGLIVLVAGDNM